MGADRKADIPCHDSFCSALQQDASLGLQQSSCAASRPKLAVLDVAGLSAYEHMQQTMQETALTGLSRVKHYIAQLCVLVIGGDEACRGALLWRRQ